jgi:hypothetical protein
MANIFFVKAFLNGLQEGKSVRFGIFLLLWVIALAVIIVGIIKWVDLWNLVSGQDAAGVIGVILSQLIFLVLIYVLFQILVIRASDVLNVEAFDSDFTVIPVMSVLTRTVGELMATMFIFIGIMRMLVMWFAGSVPYSSFNLPLDFFGFLGGEGFKGGIYSLVEGIIQAFAFLVIAYFFAEWIILSLKMYLDIKKVRQVSDGYEKAAPPKPEEPKPSA